MGSYDVDFDDYEEKEASDYNGEVPKKGIYEGVLVSLKDHTAASSGAEGFEWIFEITQEPYAGWRGWVYSNMDSTKWRTQQIVKAITGGQEKPVKIVTSEDGTDSKTVKKAKSVLLSVRQETYDDEKKGRIRTILPMDGESSSAGGKKKKKGKKDEPF